MIHKLVIFKKFLAACYCRMLKTFHAERFPECFCVIGPTCTSEMSKNIMESYSLPLIAYACESLNYIDNSYIILRRFLELETLYYLDNPALLWWCILKI